MGWLGNDHGRRWLAPRHRVGRDPAADLPLSDDPRVSWEHASLRWSGRAWELRDAGSRNGTYLDGERIPDGQWTPLRVGQVLAFGSDAQRWQLVDGRPPAAAARRDGDDTWHRGTLDLLALPPRHAVATVHLTRAGWMLDHGDRSAPVADGDVVEIDGARWHLRLPVTPPGTVEDPQAAFTIGTLHLEFAVSRDEEHVEVVARCGPETVDLGAHAYFYLLLHLARTRLEEEAPHHPARRDPGWRHPDDLARELRYPVNRINVHVHRLRARFAKAGIAKAASVIEHRPGTGERRIGVPAARLHVRTITD